MTTDGYRALRAAADLNADAASALAYWIDGNSTEGVEPETVRELVDSGLLGADNKRTPFGDVVASLVQLANAGLRRLPNVGSTTIQRLVAEADSLGRALDDLGRDIATLEKVLARRMKVRVAMPLSVGTLAWTKVDDDSPWGLYWETGAPSEVRRVPLSRAPRSIRVEATLRLDHLIVAMLGEWRTEVDRAHQAGSIVRSLTQMLEDAGA